METVNKKGKKEYILEAIPKAFDKKEEMYLLKEGYTNFKILHNNIKANVVVKNGPLKYSITGKTSDNYTLKNLNDRFFSKNIISIIKKIEKYISNNDERQLMDESNEKIILYVSNRKNENMILTKYELYELYNEICKKFSTKAYSYGLINKIVEQLVKTEILKLEIKDLIYLNSELLKLLQTNSRKLADLQLVDLGSNSGNIRINKKLSPKMQFISESITGYYTKVLFEVPDNGI